MQPENFKPEESKLAQLFLNRADGGWRYAGPEELTESKFSTQSCKIEEVPKQTADQIKEKYIQIAKGLQPDDDFEVELEPDKEKCLVFIRKISK